MIPGSRAALTVMVVAALTSCAEPLPPALPPPPPEHSGMAGRWTGTFIGRLDAASTNETRSLQLDLAADREELIAANAIDWIWTLDGTVIDVAQGGLNPGAVSAAFRYIRVGSKIIMVWSPSPNMRDFATLLDCIRTDQGAAAPVFACGYYICVSDGNPSRCLNGTTLPGKGVLTLQR